MLFKRTKRLLKFSVLLSVLFAFDSAKKTGIEGYIFRISGNRMPSPDVKLSPPRGIKSVLYIYELTNLNQVSKQGATGFYSNIQTKLIQRVESDTSGYFFALLPPGEYSLFTKKDALFYANNFDGQNNIAPVTVIAHKVTQINVNVDYDAVY
jgi:hypothetical protein